MYIVSKAIRLLNGKEIPISIHKREELLNVFHRFIIRCNHHNEFEDQIEISNP